MSDDVSKPSYSWLHIALMNFGFFGIQHGFSIQFAKMSVIYEKLGASPEQIPALWLAAPLTGFIIQPLVGYLSDRTWCFLGRRRPYFIIGALLCTIALVLMPSANSIFMAAALLWLLDASINISTQPFRAFVADTLPKKQIATGYAIQTVMIGIGGALGFQIAAIDWLKTYPWLSQFGPTSLHIQFYMCALIFMASILVTVFTTKEDPPLPSEKSQSSEISLKGWFTETMACLGNMPPAMKRLSVVQLFTWTGLFCMWIYYSVAVAHHVFGATDPHSALYEQGVASASNSMAVYQTVSTVVAFLLPWFVGRLGRVWVLASGLFLAALGLLSVWFIKDASLLAYPMVGVGFGWAVILSMPYAILVDHLPRDKYGLYMGVFNFFIVIPEILATLCLGWIMQHIFHNQHMLAVSLGGVCLLIAAIVSLSLLSYENPDKALETA
jgi:maltose/moltooligosaccharide transporter